MRQGILVVLLTLLAAVAFADHNRSRCVVVVQPGTFVQPFGGGTLFLQSPPLFFGGSFFTTSPFVTSPFVTRPSFVTAPLFVTPSPFFCAQFTTGNFSLLWCEPLQTSVVVIGQPIGIRPLMFIDRTAPFADRATAFGRAGTIVVDPLGTFFAPQVWHNPVLQPGVMTFRLRHRPAEEVAKLLNEARALPEGQFVGLGNLLIATSPSLATSGVQQSRVRDLVSALDKPVGTQSEKSKPSLSDLALRVEVFRAHADACAEQESLPTSQATLLRLVGYPCAHPIGEATWRLSAQDSVAVKGNGAEVTLRASRERDDLRLSLDGRLGEKTVRQDGKAPFGKQPVILVAPAEGGKEAVIVLLTAL